jgi:multiple sugar transport system substrate-binding protein
MSLCVKRKQNDKENDMRLRKQTILLAVVLLVLGLTTGFTSPGQEPTAEKTLTILLPVDWRPIVDEIAPKWKAQTGVSIEVISLAYDEVHDKILSSARGGADVDIVYVDTIWPAEFARAGYLMPVDDYITEEMRRGIDKPLFEQLVWDGKLWAFPFNNQSKWLFYNQAILNKAGYDQPPKTWEEMEAMSRKMMDMGLVKHGIAWGWAQAEGLICDVTAFLYGFGGQWFDSRGNWAFDSSAGIEMLEWMVKSIEAGGWADPASTSLNDRTDLNPFLVGDTAFVLNWAFAWGLIQDPNESKVVDQVKITLIPAAESSAVVSSSVTGGGGWGILSSSDTPEQAAELLQYLMSEKVQTKALELQQNMPVWTKMYNDPTILKAYPHFQAMGPQFQYAHFRPVLPWYSEWSQRAQAEVQAALTGAKSARKALDDLGTWSQNKSMEYGD